MSPLELLLIVKGCYSSTSLITGTDFALGTAIDPVSTTAINSGTFLTVQDYSELYSIVNVVTEEAVNAIDCLALLEELDSEPTREELNEALDSGKAPGKDSIPAEVLKCCKGIIIPKLHEILCLCWREGEVPQDMRDANIVALYKTKATGVTIITTVATLSLASSGSCLPESHYRYLQRESTQNRSADSEPKCPPLIW